MSNAPRTAGPAASSAIPWPPVLLAAAVAAALAFDRWLLPLPVPLAEHRAVRAVGALMLLAAVAVAGWAAIELRRHGTTIRPDRPSTTLVTTGPFAYSRNPIYLAEVIGLIGAALTWNVLALAIAAPVFAVLVTALAIRREERVLEARFGSAWEAYCQRVRRWL